MRKLVLGFLVSFASLAVHAEELTPNFICHYVKTSEGTTTFPMAFYYELQDSSGNRSFGLSSVGMAGNVGQYGFCSSMIDRENPTILQQVLYKGVEEGNVPDTVTCDLEGNGEEVSRTKAVLSPGSSSFLEMPLEQVTLMIYHYAPSADELLKIQNSSGNDEVGNHLMKMCLKLVPGSEPAPIDGRQEIINRYQFSIKN